MTSLRSFPAAGRRPQLRPHPHLPPASATSALLGDGSIQILRTPGHLGMLVIRESRSFLLTGDAAHLRVNLDSAIPCPTGLDTT